MDALLYLDFYAEKPTLFIKKQDSFRTYIGTILSLVTTIVLSIIIVFIIFCFIHDTGLTVLYDKSSKGLSSLDLNLSKNIFFYHLNDKAGNIIDKRIIRAYPYLTISSSGGTEYKLLKEVPCDIKKLINSNQEYEELLNFDVSSYKCVTMQDGEDVVLQRRSSPFKNSYINLFVAKCHNDTKNNISDCKPEEEIDSFIDNNSIYVNFFLESAAIDHHNYTHPLTKKYYQNSMSLPKDFIFSYSFFWRKIEYFTRNSLILFSYLFQSSAYMLDAAIKDKDFFPKTHVFYEDKTIGRLQFLITVEYAESYVRKYITLIDSLTLLMTGFNVITKFCFFVNYLFTKSYIYCTIFEPIVSNSKKRIFKDSFESNNHKSKMVSHSPSCSKLQLVENKKKITGLSIIKKNSKTIPFNRTIVNNMDDQKSDDIKSILTDIQNKKINSNVGVIDNFLFLFGKIFNSNNKKQLYLQRLEKVLQEELSIDYLFQEFNLLKLSFYKDLKKNDNLPNYFMSDGTPFRLSFNNVSSINNI
jgi:hypothetical protein